jgi:hypothetical protein
VFINTSGNYTSKGVKKWGNMSRVGTSKNWTHLYDSRYLKDGYYTICVRANTTDGHRNQSCNPMIIDNSRNVSVYYPSRFTWTDLDYLVLNITLKDGPYTQLKIFQAYLNLTVSTRYKGKIW